MDGIDTLLTLSRNCIFKIDYFIILVKIILKQNVIGFLCTFKAEKIIKELKYENLNENIQVH